MEKATLGFRIYKIWQILKRFAGTFHRAQTLKLRGVVYETWGQRHEIMLRTEYYRPRGFYLTNIIITSRVDL